MSRCCRPVLWIVLLLGLLLVLPACTTDRRGGSGGGGADDDDTGGSSDDDDGAGSIATGEGPCEDGSECVGGICVALIDEPNPPVYCTQSCASDCPDGMYCDSETFALAGVDFCRFGGTSGQPPTEQDPPEEAPSLPCSTDADCDTGLICASHMGESGCAPPCTSDDQCVVDMAGFSLRLATCAEEDGGRFVCLPREECYDGTMTALMDCMDMDIPF